MPPKLVMFTEKERQLKAIVKTYKDNKSVLDFLIERRNPIPLSYQAILNKYKALNPDIKMSPNTQCKWSKEYSLILSDTKVFNEFLKMIWADKEWIAKARKYKKDQECLMNRKQRQAIKDTRLAEEMGKAKVIIQQMSNPDLSEEEKFDLAWKSKRQVEIINKEVSEGGVPKAWGVTELFDINWKLLARWKEIILAKLDTINVQNMAWLKALSDIMDSSFKQNIIIAWAWSDNKAVEMDDIYDKIIENADRNNNNKT